MNDSQQKNTKRSLVIYSICIFACAVAIIGLASFSQARLTREADVIKDKLASAENLVADSKTRLDAVMTENSRLSNEIKTLTTQNEELKTYKDTTSKKLAAEEKLNELLGLKLQKKSGALTTAKKAFEEEGHAENLSAASLEIYNTIIK